MSEDKWTEENPQVKGAYNDSYGDCILEASEERGMLKELTGKSCGGCGAPLPDDPAFRNLYMCKVRK